MRVDLLGLSVLGLLVASIQTATADENIPKHLLVARTLVKHLLLENTSYEHGQPDIHFSGTCKSHTPL